MGFVLRMAGREARSAWKRLMFFFLCVALGVGAIVALRSVVQTVRGTLSREARALLAADVLVSTNRTWTPEASAIIERELTSANVTRRTETIETATMIRPADESRRLARMVELQAVQAGFPIHGRLTLTDGRAYSHHLLRGGGALVRPELLTQLGLDIGDGIVIGNRTFTIRGTIASEPGRRLGMFSLGPRVLVDYDDLEATGLLRFGSRARRALMLALPEVDIEPLVERLKEGLKDQFVNVRSYRGREDQIGEDLSKAENYLSLVGFVMVVLGGIGVWSVTRVFVHQKMRSIAVLKCLGASTRQILAIYVAQVVLLGAAGSLLGVALAGIGLQFVPETALASFGGGAPGLTVSAVTQGVGVGLLVSLFFSLVPLLDVRRIRPLLLLRDTSLAMPVPARRGFARWRQWLRDLDWTKVAVGTVVGVALVALASWQAASVRIGGLVVLGFAVTALVLHLCGSLLVRVVRPLEHVKWFPLRHAVLSVGRPGNQTRVILLAVGLGAFFILGVRALQTNLLREFSIDIRAGGADLFLIDIQPDQVEPLRGFLTEHVPGSTPRVIPVVRGRVTGVQGRRVSLDSVEDVRGRGSLAREYVMTYREQLEANETLRGGTWWGPGTGGGPEVSIEESIRERFDIDVGDRVRFDILGRSIEARVASVRRVEWSDTRSGGFMFVFRPGVLEKAPQTYIGVLRGPDDPTARALLQRDLVAKFSNVSAIDIREVARTVEGLLANVTFAITIVGAVALLSGVLILVGSVAMTKFQRLHEAAVFKTLGASTRTLGALLALEYGTLGALAGGIGAIGSLALSWGICRYVLDIRWTPAFEVVGLGIVVTSLLVLAVGVLSSLDVLERRPLSVLRAE